MNFKIQGVDPNGHFISLIIMAAGPQDARQLGQAQGIDVLAVETLNPAWPDSLRSLGSGRFPLLLFNQELLALLEAGLSVVEALETLLAKEAQANIRQVLEAVVTRLHEGLTLSAAFASQRSQFSDLYIATVRSSERSGNLIESLRRFVAYQIQIDQMRKRVISASIYPLLLMLVGGLVVMFLLVYVIPKFSHIYADTGQELPLASWLLIRWGNAVSQHGLLLAGLFFGGLACIAYFLHTAHALGWLRELAWRLPIVGERMRVYQLSRFYRTLGMLMSAGVPILPAFERVSGVLDQRLQRKLIQARTHIREGLMLSTAMERSGLSTVVAMRLLTVGERTGQLGHMLERVADFHDEQLNRWIDWAARLFEPLLMTFIGIVIGAIVVLMYIPIFELAGSIE